MFKIYGGATEFKQWDQNKMVVNPNMTDCEEVVFRMSNGKAGVSLAYEYEGEMVADVPNHLLKYSGNMMVELGQNKNLRSEERTFFNVSVAEKPEGYVCKPNRKLGKKNIVTTKQTLTEAEKEQARENIGIGCGFGTEYGTIEVLGETTLTNIETTNSFVLTSKAPALEIGKVYTVNLNGIEYSATAVDAASMGADGVTVMMCNDGADMFTGEGLVFMLAVMTEEAAAGAGYTVMVNVMDDSTSVTLSIHTEGEIVKQIDSKYIPGGAGGGGLVVNFTAGDWGNYTMDKSIHEILEAYNSGKNVVGFAKFSDSDIRTIKLYLTNVEDYETDYTVNFESFRNDTNSKIVFYRLMIKYYVSDDDYSQIDSSILKVSAQS